MRWKLIGCAVLAFAALPLALSVAQKPEKKQPMRVKPKQFDPAEVHRVFFDDVFSVLVGERPSPQAASASSVATNSPSSTAPSSSPTATEAATGGWSQTVSAATIEDEIKAIKLLLDQDVTTPADYKNRGYKECRRHFSIAAMLFGVINEYDGEVRWKESAPVARDLCARTAANSKVGASQVFTEAKQIKADLQELLNGSALANPKEASSQNEWPAICERQPLMKRLEIAFEGEVQKSIANEADFKRNKDKVLHEAEIIATIAEVLTKSGMEDGEDEAYADFAKKMKDAAREAAEGAKKGDYETVRKSAGNISQACSTCHEGFRG